MPPLKQHSPRKSADHSAERAPSWPLNALLASSHPNLRVMRGVQLFEASNCANSASVFSLNASLWFRRGASAQSRLLSAASLPPSGRKSTYPPVQILQAASGRKATALKSVWYRFEIRVCCTRMARVYMPGFEMYATPGITRVSVTQPHSKQPLSWSACLSR